MGLLKKKDRQDAPPPKEGSVLDLLPSMGEGSLPSEGGMAKSADRPETDSGSPEKAYTNELRLAVEAVASGATSAEAPSSDKYGLLAELEAQRRKADTTDGPSQAEELEDPDPTPALSEPTAAALAPEPEAEQELEAEQEPELDEAPEADEEPAVQVPEPELEPVAAVPEPVDEPQRPSAPAERSSTEARARLEAFERSILEKTEAMRQRAAELAQREQELVSKVDGLDALETETAERHAALEQRERELQAKLAELQEEAERLEEEQAIWADATRESKARSAEIEKALAKRETEIEVAEGKHVARVAKLEGAEAALASREAELDAKMDELAAAQTELEQARGVLEAERNEFEEAAASASGREQELAAREGDLRSAEDAVALRERELDKSSTRLAEIEASVSDRERDFARREADLEAREAVVSSDRDRLEQERSEWDEMMRGAFSRLSELESDLVSSLSVAGMLKRELEGRDVAAPKERRSTRSSEQDEARAFYRDEGDESKPESVRPMEVEGLKESVAEANGMDAQANATDWWARQLGRRKKD